MEVGTLSAHLALTCPAAGKTWSPETETESVVSLRREGGLAGETAVSMAVGNRAWRPARWGWGGVGSYRTEASRPDVVRGLIPEGCLFLFSGGHRLAAPSRLERHLARYELLHPHDQ